MRIASAGLQPRFFSLLPPHPPVACDSRLLLQRTLPLSPLRPWYANTLIAVGGNAVSAFLSWRLQATNSCDVTLVWKSGFEHVAQYGISMKYVAAPLPLYGPVSKLTVIFSCSGRNCTATNVSNRVQVCPTKHVSLTTSASIPVADANTKSYALPRRQPAFPKHHSTTSSSVSRRSPTFTILPP